MEILKKNYVNTTTMITVDAGTDTVEFILDHNTRRQYSTNAFDDDTTIASITFAFDETLTVDRIAIQNHNLKEFTIFYNGLTANTFALTNPTTTSTFNANSATDLFLAVTPVDCTSVTIDMKATIEANSEKAIGNIIISEQDFNFTKIPAANSYKPKYDPQQFKHTMADGGIKMHTLAQKFDASIKLKYIDETMRDNLKTLYDKFDEFIFVPFGTGTSWDGIAPQCVWTGSFNFYEYSDDVKSAGFEGSIKIEEVSS